MFCSYVLTTAGLASKINLKPPVASAAVRPVVVDSLSCLLPSFIFVVFCIGSLFCCAVFCVLSSFAIERVEELVVFLMSCGC